MNIPYVLRLACAESDNDHEKATKILKEAIDEISNRLLSILTDYEVIDFPLVSLVMTVTGQTVRAALPKSGRELVDNLMPKEMISGIDIEELIKQLTEQEDE